MISRKEAGRPASFGRTGGADMLQRLREKAAGLPLKPGVYMMLDASHTVIYVGKAKALRNRVSSYFHGEHNLKTETMVSKVADFEVIIANSEIEALVLENELIKHHMPRYNILLKDDKGYPFVRLDIKSEYPRFTLASAPAEDGAEYYGPFSSRSTVRNAVDVVCKALRLPTCGRQFPRDIGKERPCLNYHMGACPGYCRKDTPQSEYRAAIDQARLIFSGRTAELVRRLKGQMEEAAEKLRFEEAAQLRDRMKAVGALQSHQYVFNTASVDTDVVGFARDETKSCFLVLHYIDGRLLGKDFELMDVPMEEDREVIPALIQQYYAIHPTPPGSLCLPMETGEEELLEEYLTSLSGKKTAVLVPKRGDKVRFVEAACLNAREEIQRAATKEEKIAKTAIWLQKAMGLEAPPSRLEAFDISNLAGEDIVASMVVFEEGKPRKRDYRRFQIDLPGQDDYASMADAVGRRFRHYAQGDEKFAPLPDVLLIDGGEGQVHAAKAAMEATGVSVPVFGMVKDDRHRTRALVNDRGEEIGLANPAAFALIGTIQEETHRFAIEYQKKLRSRKTRKSALDGIPGVGEKRKAALLKHFQSIKAIAVASQEALALVVPKDAAKAIYEHFHEGEEKS